MAVELKANPVIQGAPAKARVFPSPDHAGVAWSPSISAIGRGEPPAIGITWIFQGLPAERAAKATVFPSGDHRGNKASIGANVNCIRSLPSMRLRQSALSGNVE